MNNIKKALQGLEMVVHLAFFYQETKEEPNIGLKIDALMIALASENYSR